MLALQRTLSFGYLSQRWTRTVLIILSIALGVATLVGTRALATNLNKGAEHAMNPLSDLADLIIMKGQTGVPRDLVDRLRQAKISGIKELYPLIVGHIGLPDLKNRSVLLLGVEADSPEAITKGDRPWGEVKPSVEALSKYTWRRLQGAMADARLGLVGEGLLQELGWDPLTEPQILKVRGGVQVDVAVIGSIVLKGESATKLGTNFVVLELKEAARLLYPRRPNFVTQVNIRLEDGADRAALRKQIQHVVGDSGKVRTVDEFNLTVRDVTAGLELGFMVGGAGALMVGLFLVFNVLSVSVAERRHDIGIMRSLGATRGQVAWLFIFEAAVLGLLGALLGVPLGWGLAKIALSPVRQAIGEAFLELPAIELEMSWLTIVFAVVAGIGTAILAALVPALQAAQEEPADAVRRVPVVVRIIYRILHIAVCVLLVSFALVAALLRDWLPVRTGAFGGAICLQLGVMVATPLLAGILGRLIQPVFRRFLGVEGRLAADNLIRSPGRTGLVIAALAATSALLMLTAGFIRSSETAIHTWLDEQIGADLFVTSGAAVSGGQWLPMNKDVPAALKKLPGVQSVLPLRAHRLDYRDRIVFLMALDADAFDDAPNSNALARHFARFPRFREPGTALISENFASLYHVDTGDTITIDGGGDQQVTLEVLGKLTDYTWNRGTILVNRDWYRKEYHDDQVDICDVWLRPEADLDTVHQTLLDSSLASDNVLTAITRAQFRADLSSVLQRIYGLAYAQQFIVGMVALLGVISALFISVLQRRRELGLLRAVGATRGQIMRSVLAEATLMGIIGAVIGFFFGVLLEWYLLEVLLVDEAGFSFPMLIPWTACGLVCGSSILTATIVGLWPAYYATKMRIPDAIAYE